MMVEVEELVVTVVVVAVVDVMAVPHVDMVRLRAFKEESWCLSSRRRLTDFLCIALWPSKTAAKLQSISVRSKD